MLPEENPDKRGSWEIVVGPRDHHERFADASPHLAEKLLRHARDGMRELGAAALPPDEPIYLQVLQNHGRQAGSRTSHLNFELYAIPQVPHRVAEEIGGAARHMISRQSCAWCAMAEAEEEDGTRLVLADERFVVLAPAASRSPFELWVIPREHAADFTRLDDEALGACRATLQRALGALGVLGDPPYNLFLHTSPAGERLDQTFHWHWELHPRLRVIAGLERATALAVNPAAPEYAAEVLRDHLAVGRPLTGRLGASVYSRSIPKCPFNAVRRGRQGAHAHAIRAPHLRRRRPPACPGPDGPRDRRGPWRDR